MFLGLSLIWRTQNDNQDNTELWKKIQRQKCFPVLRCSFCMIFRRQIKLSAIQPPLALEMSVDQFCSSSLLINSLTNTYACTYAFSLLINSLTNTYLWLLQRLQTLLQMQTLYQKHPLQCWFCWICAYTQLICVGVFIKTWILLQRAWTMFSSWRRLAIFISMHWGRATIAIAHCPTAVPTVSLEYWQICIYPRRVEQWQNRGRSPAHDGQLRSWSHQQFYKTQFIKQFITLQILSKLESKYFDAKYTFCPKKCEKCYLRFLSQT